MSPEVRNLQHVARQAVDWLRDAQKRIRELPSASVLERVMVPVLERVAIELECAVCKVELRRRKQRHRISRSRVDRRKRNRRSRSRGDRRRCHVVPTGSVAEAIATARLARSQAPGAAMSSARSQTPSPITVPSSPQTPGTPTSSGADLCPAASECAWQRVNPHNDVGDGSLKLFDRAEQMMELGNSDLATPGFPFVELARLLTAVRGGTGQRERNEATDSRAPQPRSESRPRSPSAMM